MQIEYLYEKLSEEKKGLKQQAKNTKTKLQITVYIEFDCV